MIHNQLITAGNSSNKNDLLTGQSGVEKQKGDEKAEGGLFKFLMGSIQITENDAESGEGSGNTFLTDRILGGNLTKGNHDDTPLKEILSGLEKNSIEKLSTISELLENAMKSSVSEEELAENGSILKGDEIVLDGSGKTSDSDKYEELDQEKKQPLSGGLSHHSQGSNEQTISGGYKSSQLEESNDLIPDERESVAIKSEDGEKEDESDLEIDLEVKSDSNAEVDVKGVNDSLENDIVENKVESDNIQESVSPDSATQTSVGSNEVGEKIKAQVADSEKLKSNSVRNASEAAGTAPVKRDEKPNTENVSPSKVDRPDRESGLVNQLRSGITAEPIVYREQNGDSQLNLDADENELIQKMFADLANGSIDQQAAEVRSIRANQLREIRYQNYRDGNSGRPEVILNSGAQGAAGIGVTAGTDAGKLSMVTVSGFVPESSQLSSEILDEDAANLWKEHIAEYFESKEKGFAEQAAAMSRLSMESVTNISVRRNFATSLGQSILNATGDGKKAAETWQKHTFTLENGKNIQLSAREIDGVLQLKLSSSSSELQKLLMDHQDEIRKHLEEEVNITIDLQLDSQQDGQMTGFFGESGGKKQSGSQSFDYSSGKTAEQPVEEVVPKAVRNFGYNQMEWSA